MHVVYMYTIIPLYDIIYYINVLAALLISLLTINMIRLIELLQDFETTNVLPERELQIKKYEFSDYQKSKEGLSYSISAFFL